MIKIKNSKKNSFGYWKLVFGAYWVFVVWSLEF